MSENYTESKAKKNVHSSHLQSLSELVDGIKLWLLTWLVNFVAMSLVVCQLSRDQKRVLAYICTSTPDYNLLSY